MQIVFITHLDVFEIDSVDRAAKGRGLAMCTSFHTVTHVLMLIHVLILIDIFVQVSQNANSAFHEVQPAAVPFASIFHPSVSFRPA
jgi:hypothetical protein